MEKTEINLEKIHLLIDKLKTQVSDSSGAEHLLSTAQMLVAELQTLHRTERPRPSVCVVMPSGSGLQRSSNQSVREETTIQATQKKDLDLQPPITITEQAPEEVMDQHSFGDATNITSPSASTEQLSGEFKRTAANAENEQQQIPLATAITQQSTEAHTVQEEVVNQAGSAIPPGSQSEPEFPTSIPADIPEIQPTAAETAAAIENSNNRSSDPAPTPYRAPAPPSHQHIATDSQEDNQSIGADDDQQAAASAPIEPTAGIPVNTQEPEPVYNHGEAADKKRQLDFIHENFSAWSDYGIINEAPTLIQNKVQPAANTTTTQMDLNDQLKEDREEWGHTLQSTPIDNLAAAIGINDRYLFISELFRGDESMYERSILTLNKFQNFDQAHAWSERELRLKLGWDMANPITLQFEQLVKRRFMKKG